MKRHEAPMDAEAKRQGGAAKRCVVCENSGRKALDKKRAPGYAECSDCGHVYVPHIPTTADPLKLRDRTGTHHTSPAKLAWDFSDLKLSKVYGPRLRAIERYVQPGVLLDIGCSNGSFMRAAEKCDWRARGLEISRELAACARRAGLSVTEGTVENTPLAPGGYAAVTMWQVLEHLVDPVSTVTRVAAALRPGGVLAISTPNAAGIGSRVLGVEWPAVNPEGHLNLFTPAGLRRFLTRLGLGIRAIETLDIQLATVSSLRRWLAGKGSARTPNITATIAARGGSAAMQTFLRLRAIINLPLRLSGLGEDIYCYAQKRP